MLKLTEVINFSVKMNHENEVTKLVKCKELNSRDNCKIKRSEK